MKDIIIVGAGGFGRELLQWIKDINQVKATWNIVGFIDDDLDALNGFTCDYQVMGTIQGWKPADNQVFACAIANPSAKEKVTTLLKKKGAVFATIVHPTALIGAFTDIGEGVVLYPKALITANVQVGKFVTLLSSSIGHDAIIDDYATISSYCDITGGVHIGEKVFLGSHVTVVPGRRIGKQAYIAAGSTVMTHIKQGCKVMGSPAKRMDW